MAKVLRFYLDENIPVEVARQLSARGIEAVTVRDLGLLGESGERHLEFAVAAGYVICTNDADFLRVAATGIDHSGIIFGQQSSHYIGDWVNRLTLMHAVYSADEMQNRVEYL